LANDLPIYNNTLRTTPEGGNDFWESGAVRPDLILEDLIQVFHYDGSGNLNYYFRLED
jgi:iron complex transport system substrate-binding protein